MIRKKQDLLRARLKVLEQGAVAQEANKESDPWKAEVGHCYHRETSHFLVLLSLCHVFGNVGSW